MLEATMAGFFDELEKIAEHATIEEAAEKEAKTVTELIKHLRPGDVLFTSPDRKSLPLWASVLYKPISRMVQGTDFGHAALYVGDGKIIDGRMGRTIKATSLRTLAGINNIVALRPNVPESEKKEAVEYAHSQLGKEFDLKGIARAATRFRGERQKGGPEEASKMICSALIANAYYKQKFSDSSRLYTRPSEILHSKILEPIAALIPHNRDPK